MTPFRWLLALCLALALPFASWAEPLTAIVQAPPPAGTGYFKLGTTTNPAGHEISVNSRSLLYDGQPVFPVMGEFHYSRCPQNEWRTELLKMKAGGVNIVATYVFWIHHEEIEGQWDWSGDRDLRKFIETCGELGLKAVVRCGPWCHGEVRSGGFPDWLVAKGWKLRSTDTNYLAAVKILYGQIAQQLSGQLWKDGGPVIGIQVDNEFGGAPEYLLALKKLAIAAGLDVPLYIKTGWPAMRRPVPLGELLPLFGCYADGFWSRGLQPMDGSDWEGFTFKITRTDTGIGNDVLGTRKSGDAAGTEKYPYLTCEVGGGMPASYHRRINLDPRDVEAVALTQLGGGSSLMGYYMYHGGQNPEGKFSTLQESLSSGYNGYNDLPVKNYDFGAPLGEYGQVNPQYHWLRRLHLFLHDFGDQLATYPTTLPDLVPTNKTDLTTLRWAVRSDGSSGCVFVNNYQRLQPLPAKDGVQFKLQLPGGELLFPSQPITIPADGFFFWPFNLNLGDGKLIYATAQPVCRYIDNGDQIFFFAETPGVPAEFVFNVTNNSVSALSGTVTHTNGQIHVQSVRPGHGVAIRLNQHVAIVLLSDSDSLALWKEQWRDDERLFLTRANLLSDNGATIKLTSENPQDLTLDMFPAPKMGAFTSADGNGAPEPVKGIKDGLFAHFKSTHLPATLTSTVHFDLIQPAGAAREIPFSAGKSHIALAPNEADFASAAVWKIKLPANLDFYGTSRLRIEYSGDVARLTLNGKLLDDQFYNGRSFDLGLNRYAPDVLSGDLRLQILLLRRDAPIYLPDEAKPRFGQKASIAQVQSMNLVRDYELDFHPVQ